MNGWTGRISVINIYKNMQGTSNMGTKDIIFDFSEEEKKVMDSLLTSFSKFEKEYTSDGPIYCDIDYHWLAYFNKMTTDSITIYIPLSSEQIPASLRRYIKLLLTKFWNQSSSPPLWLRPVY